MSDGPITNPDGVRKFFRTTVAREWGIRLDARMGAMKINDADLARMVGTTPQTIFKIKRGQVVPREYLRTMIALALCCDASEVFPSPTRAEILKAVAA